jgi:hypothetical protein
MQDPLAPDGGIVDENITSAAGRSESSQGDIGQLAKELGGKGGKNLFVIYTVCVI